MDLARIILPCPGCAASLSPGAQAASSGIVCPRCGEEITIAGGDTAGPSAPERCVVCGCPDLYWKKDFPQKIGCLIVLAGAVLVPWTWGLSLAVVALLDFLMYQALPKVSVCYVCRARYRGAPPHPAHGPYDLLTAQRREARSLRWADGTLRPAFGPGETGEARQEP